MSRPKVIFKDLGIIDYKDCWDYQTKLFQKTVDLKIYNRKNPDKQQKTPNYLIFCNPHIHSW